MSLTVSSVTTATSTTSGATLDLTGVTAAIGDWLVLAVAADNAGTSGVSSTSATITDAAGNTWTRRSVTNQTAGAASDGSTLSIWTCPVTATLTSATITVNFSPNTTAKAATLKKVVRSAGETIQFDSVGAGVTGTAASFSSGNVSVASGFTIFGYVAIERFTAPTSDSDTTNGSWSTAQTAVANTGSSTNSQAIGGQHKTATAAGNQSYDPGAAGSVDYALNYIILYPAILASFAVTEAADVGALTVFRDRILQLAAVEDHDTASFTATAYYAAHFAVVEAPDTAAFHIKVVHHLAEFAVSERPDRASFQMVPVWPTPLPPPSLQGYAFTPASAVERRPMEIGAPRVYRRTKRPTIDVAVAWQLNHDQQSLLDGFQTSILQQGAQWFGIELAFPSGLAIAVARFKDKLTMKLRGGDRWQTTATLELLAWPTMTEAALAVLLDDVGDPPAWPDDLLPYPILDTWELTPKPATIRTDDLPGLPQARQRSRNSTTEATASWELSAAEAAIFDGFFRWRGRDGAQWFEFPLVQARGTAPSEVRFLGEADWTPRGRGRWNVAASIEIRKRSVMSAEDVIFRLTYPNGFLGIDFELVADSQFVPVI